MFNEQKAAQIAAWFLGQAGGAMPHLKLMKLMYLADRQAMARCGFSMTGDRFVSMPHGPVLSNTLSHINDEATSSPDGWDSWISDKANHEVALVRNAEPEALDLLSAADLDVLSSTWEQFGHYDKYKLRDYTHDPENCPEWRDPNGSSLTIHYRAVFAALGHDRAAAIEMAQGIAAQQRIARELYPDQ